MHTKQPTATSDSGHAKEETKVAMDRGRRCAVSHHRRPLQQLRSGQNSSTSSTTTSTSAAAAPNTTTTTEGPQPPNVQQLTWNVQPGPDGDIVTATFKIGENLTNGLTKDGARYDTIKILKYAQQVYPNLAEVDVHAMADMWTCTGAAALIRSRL
jgi:hypothetical protein